MSERDMHNSPCDQVSKGRACWFKGKLSAHVKLTPSRRTGQAQHTRASALAHRHEQLRGRRRREGLEANAEVQGEGAIPAATPEPEERAVSKSAPFSFIAAAASTPETGRTRGSHL